MNTLLKEIHANLFLTARYGKHFYRGIRDPGLVVTMYTRFITNPLIAPPKTMKCLFRPIFLCRQKALYLVIPVSVNGVSLPKKTKIPGECWSLGNHLARI